MTNPLTILQGDVMDKLRTLPDESVHCVVTSPPYWGLRDYGVEGQIGLEKTPTEYLRKMVEVFREVRRVLRRDGTAWVNMGDGYAKNGGPGWQGKNGQRADRRFRLVRDTVGMRDTMRRPPLGLKAKDLIGMPWRLAFALQADGWYLRQDIIWHKPNPMPESVTDRCTKAHEYIFMFSKSCRYFYNAEAIKEPAIYFDDDRKGRASLDHKSTPTTQRNGIRPVYKDARSYDGKHSDKQRGHSRRHAGFNDRWDHMDKAEQCSAMRNKRSVWTIATQPYPEAHFATFPEHLPKLCILAGSPPQGVVLDPFAGSGTTGKVALELGRRAILIELNPAYIALIEQRCNTTLGFPI